MRKKFSEPREQWHGLSETDTSEKLDHRLPSQMPAERRAEVTEKIISRMRDRGVIIDATDLDPALDRDEEDKRNDVDIDLTLEPVAADDVTTATT